MTSDQGSWDRARAQAEELLGAISAAESVVLNTIERECHALRSGCMLAARALHTRLCDAVKFYLDAIRAARASLAALEQVLPGSQDYLEERRTAFSALLKLELAVLASEYAAAGAGQHAMSFTGESLLASVGKSSAEASLSGPEPNIQRKQGRVRSLPQRMQSRAARSAGR